MKNKILKNYIRVLRAEKNISQQALAEAVGVSRQTIHAIETQKYDPSCHLALRIAEFFEVGLEKVFWLAKE